MQKKEIIYILLIFLFLALIIFKIVWDTLKCDCKDTNQILAWLIPSGIALLAIVSPFMRRKP